MTKLVLQPELLKDSWQQLTLIDVRAPVEFKQGHWPGAVNLPLMNDDERHKVGICYKQHGQEAAVRLGHRLVSGDIKAARIHAWHQCARQKPEHTIIYCARGGMRSNISRDWLQQAGITLPLIAGGYKSLRHWLLQRLEDFIQQAPVWVVAGRTGSGKTRVLQGCSNALDLEGLAHHRGSAFGALLTPQPTQAQFENELALAAHALDWTRPVIVEDESRNIGSVHLPQGLSQRIREAEVVVVQESLAQRVAFILDDYVVQLQQHYRQQQGEEAGLQAYQTYFEQAFARIARRLGGERYQRVMDAFQGAMAEQRRTTSIAGHEGWVTQLLTEYYDRMYDYQLKKAPRPVRFQGRVDEVIDFLRQTV
ncbi:MAG: tRNA 2-selenouridine(34) synthase MnmH [Marinobacter sp.]|nr:tRNA 2-selenouridine(34) synthase MnmH [Marinobacter sp.]